MRLRGLLMVNIAAVAGIEDIVGIAGAVGDTVEEIGRAHV